MKRYFKASLLSLIIVLLAMFFCQTVQALDERQLYATTVVNTGGLPQKSSIATTTIINGQDRIIGYEVCPIYGNSRENFVALYDGTSTDPSPTLFGETEARTGESRAVFFPLARPISTQLTLYQGAQTAVTIYYVRFIQ